MTKESFRMEYLASLHGHTFNANRGRTFPKLKNPKMYADWNTYYRNKSERSIGGSDLDNIWLCSDHHFSHKNIIKHANRPYDDIKVMNNDMLDKHNALVNEDDIVFMLGDVVMGSTDLGNKFLDQMNGYKILLIGNHDWERGRKKIKEYNVDEMHVSYYLDFAGVMMTHAPFDSHIPFSNGFLSIHGHIHENVIDCDQYRNVCVEHTDYAPIKLSEIINGG